MHKLLLKNLDVKNKRVLMRVDFNVPLNSDGTISDDTRIQEALPSIKNVLERGGSVVLLSHLGRPDGKKNPKYSLKVCGERLEKLLGQKVDFIEDCIGEEAVKKCQSLPPHSVVLLENLRFYPAEEKPSLDFLFAEKLKSLGDCYVNDGFGVSHRHHASVTELPKFFPEQAAAGFLMEKELKNLYLIMENPPRPFYAIIGGSKISSKIGVLKALLQKVDGLFIGGGMTYTFLKANGLPIGDSIVEDSQLQTAKNIQAECKAAGVSLFLAQDIVAADSFSNDANTRVFDAHQGISPGWQGMDIGPQTIKNWEKAFQGAKTFFWNGPVGVFEFPTFATGTRSIAETLANISAIKIVGGGDSVAAIQAFGLKNSFSHLSTGGGASLELIEQGSLPGVEALTNA